MLHEFIKSSGETQAKWAGRLGISRAYLSMLTSGQKTPGLDLAVRIERATGGAVTAASWVPEMSPDAIAEEGEAA